LLLAKSIFFQENLQLYAKKNMSLTPSSMLDLGTKAPTFELFDVVSQNIKSLAQLQGKNGTVILFICNHCPYVKHIEKAIVDVAHQYTAQGFSFIAINANDAEAYPEDSPEKMRETALQLNFNFPYLFDETQQVAKAYQAECTPDFYVFDSNMSLVYRGQFDNARPANSNIPDGKRPHECLRYFVCATNNLRACKSQA
jgi:peroxiredoxin